MAIDVRLPVEVVGRRESKQRYRRRGLRDLAEGIGCAGDWGDDRGTGTAECRYRHHPCRLLTFFVAAMFPPDGAIAVRVVGRHSHFMKALAPYCFCGRMQERASQGGPRLGSKESLHGGKSCESTTRLYAR